MQPDVYQHLTHTAVAIVTPGTAGEGQWEVQASCKIKATDTDESGKFGHCALWWIVMDDSTGSVFQQPDQSDLYIWQLFKIILHQNLKESLLEFNSDSLSS